jgi:DNA-nicking Smr family endonuclease
MSSDRSHRRLSDEEHMLWRRVTRAVAPLRQTPRPVVDVGPSAPLGKHKPSSTARAHVTAVATRPRPKQAPELSSNLAALGRREKQRLARGTLAIDARIDLHGKTQREAHAALLAFLQRSQRDGARFVLVITGKGTRAADARNERGVLKRQVPLWLQLPEFRSYVVGFEDAHVGHGGEGALYVRVRKARM